MNRLIFFNNTAVVDTGSASVNDPSEVVDQQFAVLDPNNLSGGTLNLTGANATDEMILVQGDDKTPLVSQIIKKSQVKRVISKDFQAYVNQVTHIGFSGSGSEDLVVADGDNFVKLVRLEKGFEQFPRATADFTKVSADTSYDIGNKIAAALNSLGGNKSFVRADVLANQAASNLVDTQATPADVTLDVTEGSDVVVANLATATNGANIAAGDFLRIGGVALSDPVYEVKAVGTAANSKQEITLDRPYGGKTATGVDAGKLDAALTTQEAGVEITAKDIDEVSDFVESLSAISFSTSVSSGFDGTTVAIGTTPKTGSGTPAQLRAVEEFAFGMQHSFYYRNYFPQDPESYVDEAKNYDVVVIVVELDNDDAVVRSNKYLEIVTAWDEAANIGTQLETFFGVS